MNKKIYKILVPIMVLLLTLGAFFGMMTMTGAESTDSYFLTINYGTGCDYVELTIPGQQVQKMDSSVAYAIPKTSDLITIRVVPKTGYEVDSMLGESVAYQLDDNNSFTWRLTENDTIELTCRPKEYEIKYLAADEGSLQFPTGIILPQSHLFGTETKIPFPVLSGYRFQYWILLPNKDAKDSDGQILSPKEGDDFVTIGTNQESNTGFLYLKPKWEPLTYVVTRYDCIYDPNLPDHRGTLLGVVDLPDEMPMGQDITGNMGGDKHYPGFYYISDSQYYSTGDKVTVRNESNWNQVNIVYRLYLPIEYALEFVSGYGEDIVFPDGTVIPEKHVYNKLTELPTPVRTGYDFVGWTVKVIKKGTAVDFENITDQIGIMDENYAGDKDTSLVLTANWKAKEYTVHIDRNTGAADDEYDYAEKYVFDKGLTVPDPTRKGYTFTGWLINGGTELQNGTLDALLYADDITMVAQWQANEYTVILDGNGAEIPGTANLTAVFDTALNVDGLVLPQREGHKFLGFTVTKDGDDLIIDADGKFIPATWSEYDSDTTLYAKWAVIPYNVTVNVPNGTQVWLNDILYTGEPLSFNYGSTIHVKVVAADGYKVTAWQGSSVVHAHIFETDFVMGAGDIELQLKVLPKQATPAFRVDYVNEIFYVENGITDGTYHIICGTETLTVRVQNGEVYVNNVKVTQIAIPEGFFGKEVSFIMLGDGVTDADSDADTKTLAVRHEAPTLNDHIDGIYSDTTSIVVKLNPNSVLSCEYEFALYLDKEGKQLVADWVSAVELSDGTMGMKFENLNPGTYYYVYARVKASPDNYPHGEVNIFQQITYFDDYLNQKIAQLQALIQEGDGELVKALIEKAIADAKALTKPSATFYHDLEGIYNRAVSEVPFAREQDSKIAALCALRDELIATGEFNSEATLTLNTLCEDAVTVIKAAATQDEIDTAYNTACVAMKAVKITYLVYDSMNVTSSAGLSQGTKLFLMRLSDLSSLVNSVDSAIKTGKISVASGSKMTLADAAEALQSLDVMAAYSMRLSNGSATLTSFEGSFTFRLLLPEDLRGITGLQVAYYDEKTGVLEVVDTTRDGNYLVFSATQVGDFVILGDPTMSLTGIIASLGVILLCQLIAIVILLVRRSKYAKEVRRYSVMLPVLLTIRFLPDHAIAIIAILGGLVVLSQIVLMYLLLSSEMIYRRKHNKPAPTEPASEETLPVMAESETEETLPEEDETTEMAEDDGALNEYAQASAVFDAFDEDEVIEDESVDEDSEVLEETEELYADEDTEQIDVVDGDDAYGFIEPAANPRYSLPDEELSEYADDAAEGDSDELEAGSEVAEWAYDDEESAPVDEELSEDVDAADEENTEWQEDEVAVSAAEWQYDDVAEESLEADGSIVEETYENESDVVWGEETTESTDENTEDAAEDAGTIELSDEMTEAAESEEVLEEATEEEEPEIYIEPDARGDDAPAPEYLADFEDGESEKQNGYEG